MNSEKITLPSLRNIEWRTVKTETNKINQVLPYISKNNITELNKLIYARAKLVYRKIGIPLKSTKKKSNQDGNFDGKRRWKIYEKRPKWKRNTRKDNSTTRK